MYRTACPSCGAEVLFRSTISTIAVCEYCQSTVLRDADEVKDIGKIGRVLEDYSPIQIGTSGTFAKRNFTVVGRIQLHYDAGLWNEWYVMFDDGSGGWLADASGQYMFTLDIGPAKNATPFEQMHPEFRYEHAGRSFIATDVRTARCVGGQGELPFIVGEGYEAKVVDCRSGDRFLTIDYSDGTPRLYAGSAVVLDELNCQLLRDGDQILQTAGKLKGANNVLDCPNCGSPLNYKAGVATQIVCPACTSEVDCSGDRATVLAKHEEANRYHATLDIGDKATIEGDNWWTVIGLIELEEVGDDDSGWSEYLLYHAKKGFKWLVETSDGWYEARVLDKWPDAWGENSATFNKEQYRKLYPAYDGRVTYAAGAFNWRVKVGDVTTYRDYERNGVRLGKESTRSEVNWTTSKKLTNELVAQWFGKQEIVTPKYSSTAAPADNDLSSMATLATIILLVINVPIMLFGNFFSGLIWTGLAWWLLRLPLKFNKDN
ncbi:DUF4178 domain-containing protein [Chitinilyticum aquatile]|uniref:DUF4178 domain-containing protein n=1 Tax=Chitinilyticum aquatile TaxID=362520 RepID=UPI00042653B7|nr:DUF4178 domain-containing protein [Chitinilyticum aquatile]